MRFVDGKNVPVNQEVKYVGCLINKTGDPNRELQSRISVCVTMLSRLHRLWRHRDCNICLKLRVYDAVVRP